MHSLANIEEFPVDGLALTHMHVRYVFAVSALSLLNGSINHPELRQNGLEQAQELEQGQGQATELPSTTPKQEKNCPEKPGPALGPSPTGTLNL